jgi:hypothetical protein
LIRVVQSAEGEKMGGSKPDDYSPEYKKKIKELRKVTKHEFDRQLHYLDGDFKRSLRDFRWRWVFPEELDRAINPVLLAVPDVFDRVFSPEEWNTLMPIVYDDEALQMYLTVIDWDKCRDLLASLAAGEEITAAGSGKKYQIKSSLTLDETKQRYPALKNVGKQKEEEIRNACAQFIRRNLENDFESKGLAQLSLLEDRYPQIVSMIYCARTPDLGEWIGKQGEWAMPLDKSTWDEWEARRDKRIATRGSFLPLMEPKHGLKDQWLIHLHPGLEWNDVQALLTDIGFRKGSGPSGAIKKEGQAILMALRWWICRKQARQWSKEKRGKLRGTNIWAIIADWLDSNLLKEYPTDTIESWCKSEIRKAKKDLDLSLTLQK